MYHHWWKNAIFVLKSLVFEMSWLNHRFYHQQNYQTLHLCSTIADEASEISKNRNKVDSDNKDKDEENKNGKTDKICKFFLKNSCKHGKKGDNCSFVHPKMCFQWTRMGNCKDKTKCSIYYHPKLCNTNKNGSKCQKDVFFTI